MNVLMAVMAVINAALVCAWYVVSVRDQSRARSAALKGSAEIHKTVAEKLEGAVARPRDPGGIMDLRELQRTLPWGQNSYSADYLADPRPHRDLAHAVLDLGKAAGRLMALVGDLDHTLTRPDPEVLRAQYARYAADVVICALRVGNVFPGGVLDLQAEIEQRLKANAVTHQDDG